MHVRLFVTILATFGVVVCAFVAKSSFENYLPNEDYPDAHWIYFRKEEWELRYPPTLKLRDNPTAKDAILEGGPLSNAKIQIRYLPLEQRPEYDSAKEIVRTGEISTFLDAFLILQNQSTKSDNRRVLTDFCKITFKNLVAVQVSTHTKNGFSIRTLFQHESEVIEISLLFSDSVEPESDAIRIYQAILSSVKFID